VVLEPKQPRNVTSHLRAAGVVGDRDGPGEIWNRKGRRDRRGRTVMSSSLSAFSAVSPLAIEGVPGAEKHLELGEVF